jgi:hypothetical protein
MIQPLVIAHGGFARRASCWRVDQIEKVVNPSGSHRANLDVLGAGAAKAMDLSAGACPRALPQNSRAFLEQRLLRSSAGHHARGQGLRQLLCIAERRAEGSSRFRPASMAMAQIEQRFTHF